MAVENPVLYVDSPPALIAGAYVLLRDQLKWTEEEMSPGAWSVHVTVDGCDWAGTDGHLLASRDECRLSAFVDFLEAVGVLAAKDERDPTIDDLLALVSA